jgi:hypothetical protein
MVHKTLRKEIDIEQHGHYQKPRELSQDRH